MVLGGSMTSRWCPMGRLRGIPVWVIFITLLTGCTPAMQSRAADTAVVPATQDRAVDTAVITHLQAGIEALNQNHPLAAVRNFRAAADAAEQLSTDTGLLALSLSLLFLVQSQEAPTDEAGKAARFALAALDRSSGSTRPATLMSALFLGLGYLLTEPPRAATPLTLGLRISEQTKGSGHPLTAAFAALLAAAHVGTGRPHEAAPFLARAVAVADKLDLQTIPAVDSFAPGLLGLTLTTAHRAYVQHGVTPTEAISRRVALIAQLLGDAAFEPGAVMMDMIGSLGPKLAERSRPAPRPVTIPALREALKDPSPTVRASAVAALVTEGRSGKPGAVAALYALDQIPKPILGDFLKNHPDPFVRLEVAAALGRIGPGPEETAALIDALGDVAVREDAANALKPLANTLVPALEQDLRTGLLPARRRAALVLRWIAPAASAEVLRILTLAFRNDDDPEVRLLSIHGVAATGTDALPMLRAAIQHSDPRVRGAAVEEIGNFGFHAEDAVDMLKALAQHDPEPEVRATAEAAIQKIQGR